MNINGDLGANGAAPTPNRILNTAGEMVTYLGADGVVGGTGANADVPVGQLILEFKTFADRVAAYKSYEDAFDKFITMGLYVPAS